MTKISKGRKIRDAGFKAFNDGLPIDQPSYVTREMDRAYWEMGWREAKRQKFEADHALRTQCNCAGTEPPRCLRAKKGGR